MHSVSSSNNTKEIVKNMRKLQDEPIGNKLAETTLYGEKKSSKSIRQFSIFRLWNWAFEKKQWEGGKVNSQVIKAERSSVSEFHQSWVCKYERKKKKNGDKRR